MSSSQTAYRTHNCGELRRQHLDLPVRLAGWVHKIRNFGGLLFVDLRDHYGITQVIFNQQQNGPLFEKAAALKHESVAMVSGVVVARSEENLNPKLPTGEIEVLAGTLEIDTLVEELPFQVNVENAKILEELRLKYRFLDLRRSRLHDNIVLRARIIREVRNFMHQEGFIEFQTPILTVSSPEGARDYLVPSRVHPGKFYALPQAPQQYKQLVMCSGFDRYFQIAPCFRDEDARADRSPGEFYQLDIEMAFINQDDLFPVVERLFEHLTAEVSQKHLVQYPFPRVSYRDAMDLYGTDKPDLRFGLELQEVSPIFRDSELKMFAENCGPKHCVKALVLSDSAGEPRSFFDKMDETARQFGLKGLPYLSRLEGQFKGSLAKRLSESEIEQLCRSLDLKTGDAAFFAAGEWEPTCKALGQMRNLLAKERLSVDQSALAFCWIVDFPMFEWNPELNKIDFSHNPFSMPQGGMEALNTMDPLEITACQYDLVCNGIELSSGAIRNHRPDIMQKAFEIAGYSQAELESKFSHMLNAFRFGAPPHGGIAPGIDRMVMIYAEEQNIREVILYPMNQNAQELMTGSPSEVSAAQLKELHLKIEG